MAGHHKIEPNIYGDGFSWKRGSLLGKGGFGSVYIATLKNPNSKHKTYPTIMAVKSSELSLSGSIKKERQIIKDIQGCPDIIQCYGEETTMGRESEILAHNMLLEYGSGGTLADSIEESNGKGLPELETRIYTRCLVRGLKHMHEVGYVHCDMKPDNILLVPNYGKAAWITEYRAKIADFGLSKRSNASKKRKLDMYWRGTPTYLSPEAVKDCVQEAPCDVWALGCIVLEMLTGRPVWDGELNVKEILGKIVKELPMIPDELSRVAKDFLSRCFMIRPKYRATCEMLLRHPFLEGLIEIDEVDEFELEDEEEEEVEEYCSSDQVGYGGSDQLLAKDLFPNYGGRSICII